MSTAAIKINKNDELLHRIAKRRFLMTIAGHMNTTIAKRLMVTNMAISYCITEQRNIGWLKEGIARLCYCDYEAFWGEAAPELKEAQRAKLEERLAATENDGRSIA